MVYFLVSKFHIHAISSFISKSKFLLFNLSSIFYFLLFLLKTFAQLPSYNVPMAEIKFALVVDIELPLLRCGLTPL